MIKVAVGNVQWYNPLQSINLWLIHYNMLLAYIPQWIDHFLEIRTLHAQLIWNRFFVFHLYFYIPPQILCEKMPYGSIKQYTMREFYFPKWLFGAHSIQICTLYSRKLLQKLDFWPENAHSIAIFIWCALNSNVVLY